MIGQFAFEAKYGVMPKTGKSCKNCLKNEFCHYLGRQGHLPKKNGEHEVIGEPKGGCGLTITEFIGSYGVNWEHKPCNRCFGGYKCSEYNLGLEGHLPKADGTHAMLKNYQQVEPEQAKEEK